MATAPATVKRNYRCSQSLEQFYSGGPLVVSSDASLIVCACGDEIKIVASSNGAVKATLAGGESEAITALALTPDDRLLFSSGHSRLIRVWDLQTNKCIRSWKGHDGPVRAMVCHASAGLLATAGADKKVCVWDVDGGFCTHLFKGHQGVVTCIKFHKDPTRLILFSGSEDTTVRVWNLESKKCIAVLEKHFSAVTCLGFSEDGQNLLSAGRDKVVNIWDLNGNSFNKTVPIYEVVEGLCVVESESSFSSCFYQPATKKKQKYSTGICFLTVGERGIVRIWNTEGAVCLYEQQNSDVTPSSEDEESARGFLSAIILPSDQGLMCVTADQQFLFYSPMKSSEGLFLLRLYKRLVGYNEEILDMKFLGDDERHLAVATNLEQVRIYDVESLQCAYVLSGHVDIVVCLDTCTLSSGKSIVVTGSKDKTVRLWDAQSRCCIGVGQEEWDVGAVTFSKKDRDFFVSGSSKFMKVWSFSGDAYDADQEITLKAKAGISAHDKDINSLTVSPNDALVCSGSEDRTARLWKLPDLVSAGVLRGHKRGIWSVEFSPVDKCVITSSGDRTIKIWSVSDCSCLKTFEGHTSSVLRASYISRGTQFISCGGDGLIKLWTIKTNECIATYDKHEGKVWALAVGKKTEMLATGGTDAILNLWQDCTAADKDEAFQKEEEAVLRGQELENALSEADYTKAIQLAFELRRPHKLLDLFSQLCRQSDSEAPIDNGISGLRKEEIRVLLEYIREWNTKPKLCHVANLVLSRVFRIFPPTEIVEVKGISELLEGLIPYSQRHFNRIDRLVRSTFLLDYILSRMQVIEPGLGESPLTNNQIVFVEKDAENQDPVESSGQVIGVNFEHETGHITLETKEKSLSKKRKSSKLKGSSEKKGKLHKHKHSTLISS